MISFHSFKAFISRDVSIPERIVRIVLGLSVLTVLLFSWPNATSPYEWGKVWLLGLLLAVGVIAWAVHVIQHGMRRSAITVADVIVLSILLVWILSTILSIYRYASIIGVPGSAHHSLSAIAALTIFWWLSQWTFPQRKDKRPLIAVLLVVMFIGTLWASIQVIINSMSTTDIAVNVANPFVMSNDLMSMLVAVGSALAVLLSMNYRGRAIRTVGVLWGALGILALIILDTFEGWFVFGIAMLIILIREAVRRRGNTKSGMAIPLILIILSTLGLLVTFSIGRAIFISDLSLNPSTGWAIVKNTFVERPLLGTGPETFFLDFNQLRPVEFNETSQWNLRFIRSNTELSHLLPTVGILGVLTFVALFFWMIVDVLRTVFRRRDGDETQMILLVGLILTLPLFLTGIWRTWSIAVLFVAFLGVLITSHRDVPTLKRHVRIPQMLRITIGILLILVSLSAGTFLVKVWVADHALINGQEALAEDPELAEQHFRSSIRQNTQAPQARYLMGNALLQQAFSSEGDAIRAQAILDEAILTIRDGAELSPKDITGVEQLIRIYRTLSTLTGGTENVLPDLYTRAFILDPVNPILLIDAGEYYLTLDRTLPREEGDTSRPWANIAFEAFAHAQSLKTDLADAQLGIALTYEQLGDTENASAEFIALALAFSDDPGAHFELGDWYFRQGNHESAEQSFLTVIDIESGHANAHFRLSQIYEQQGTNDKAIAELEEVLKTNPGNEEVLAKIETLRTE